MTDSINTSLNKRIKETVEKEFMPHADSMWGESKDLEVWLKGVGMAQVEDMMIAALLGKMRYAKTFKWQFEPEVADQSIYLSDKMRNTGSQLWAGYARVRIST